MNLVAFKQDLSHTSERPPGFLPGAGTAPMYDMIELMFFAYRDFVGDADHMLATLGFGRAHHRVLHFVARQPGLTVAELLDILRITKQSLNRVLKELLDKDYVEARQGLRDRRQRRLFPTPRGEALAFEAASLQTERFARVFTGLPHGARQQALGFLLSMVDPDGQDKIAAMTGAAGAASGQGLQF
ncbi:MAG: MarR family transcriptional regulator [Beijerinckiaceae bacterium]|nr:MarR family transcriptional regulator [Beijerinckiaceae bacterium]MCI0736920.1 MarR family transcriptional regulator [Beijerinckiaceae bacterium]